ncbi:hypothetical protein, conserved [Plasmodium ovale]|uniref:PIR protein n=1 Tax=Plasmodium ovale TaxID=36330 RepID=A0A1C3KGS3_PLAOA|nr:hypothetical protein, conserved [Plasmodium ovale]
MTKGKFLDDLPSIKYKKELERGIRYEDVDRNISGDILTTYVQFWGTTWPNYLGDYINDYMNDWSKSNFEKRCRDLNYILDFILKKIEKKLQDSQGPYELIKNYINQAAITHLKPWDDECIRDSKIPEYSDDIENMKNIDDLCEDITYINGKFSEINSDHCNEIKSYIDRQITSLKEIYISSPEKYFHILKYYDFTTFDNLDSITGRLKFKCQHTTGAPLAGDQSETSQYSGRSASIIAVTSLSGILSSALLLYKTTSFGSILNTLVRNKIKFRNNLSDEAYYETLEDIPESSHDGAYNILYNSVGDS